MSSAETSSSSPRVSVKDLTVAFGQIEVIKEISFDVEPGEIFVIMGPSGSGKSVTLKTIMGLLQPTSGSVTIGDLPSGKSETYSKYRTSMVFQAGALFNSLTVFDNLAFYPREHRLHSKEKIKEKVEETLKMLSLEKAAQKFPSELSGGMKKRVAIARSLVMEPTLLLYDEPTSELDPIMSVTISEIIATLRKELNVTSIVVSHDRDLADNIADRVALIHEGRLIGLDSPKRLRQSDDPIIQRFFNPQIDLDSPSFRQTTFSSL
jgi:phospholipid/cholesterol/gamma-HCH transport system ATP-binding protein